MRLIVTGPGDFDNYDLVKATCNKLTFRYDTVELLQDVRPGKEYASEEKSVYFPMGLRWFRQRWRRDKGFDTTRYIIANYTGSKMWGRGVKEQRIEIIQAATAMIAFWEVGSDDDHTEDLIRLAKLYDLHLRTIKV